MPVRFSRPTCLLTLIAVMNTSPALPDLAFMRLEKNGDVLLDVHVVPNAAKTQAVGLHGEAGQMTLRVRLQAPPVDGKANQAPVKWLSGCLDVPQQAVTLARGETSRRKQLRVQASAASQATWDELLKAAGGPTP
jgi:uncharacterized protein (TIGR00251 family)